MREEIPNGVVQHRLNSLNKAGLKIGMGDDWKIDIKDRKMTNKYEEIKQLISKAQEPFTGTSAHMELGFYAPLLLKALELACERISIELETPMTDQSGPTNDIERPEYWIEKAEKINDEIS
jgi:hypothetical protein